MWGLSESTQVRDSNVPVVSWERLGMLGVQLVALRIIIHYWLQKILGIRQPKGHLTSSLEFSYFYHLAIIILSTKELNWNMFDLEIWVYTYVVFGMLRKAIHIINTERNRLLNDYAYNNHIMAILTSSRVVAYVLIPLGTLYTFWVLFSFLGILFRVINLLCFPAVMLVVDSVFLLLISYATEDNLVFYYNQNINKVPPTYKTELYYVIVSSSIKIWHFYNLAMVCARAVFDNIDFLDCLWIISVLTSLYSSVSLLISTTLKYHSLRKLNKVIAQIFKKVESRSHEICTICMEPLLNCHQLIACGHIFHYKCFLQWVQNKEECPVCRIRINLHA